MATGPLAPVVRYLRKVTNPAASGELSDAELLCRFARQREEAAFSVLVRRHGPMVLAVCHRVLRDGHAAEDAFQATFLVLARKAGSLAQPELLGNWLYGVAYRTAMKARTEAAKRRIHEAQAVRTQEIDPNEELDRHDLHALVDEEINRLPQRYRVPVVLCYLQGQTNDEAARRLGCSRGTIATLLARARDKLRRRLTQRGIGLSAAVALGALTPAVQSGTVPLALGDITVKAATLLAAGQTQAVGALAAGAVALAKGVSKAMLIEKLKIPVAILIVTALVSAGAGVSAYRADAPGSEVAESASEPKPRPLSKAEGPRKHVAAPAEVPEVQKATFRTTNFVVTAPTKEIARQVGEAAEHNRKALALLWLGEEWAEWDKPCPVRVTVTEKTVGSVSVFRFDEGVVSRDGMVLEGPLDRIFADLLPHEMTHTILADWRGRPVPRWADEGAAMLSESAISRAHQEEAMARLLRIGHPMPLTELLPRLDYPKNVLGFYAQSFSLADFLVTKGGRKKFLTFVAKGADNGWSKAAQFVYGYKSLEALEQAWLDHARKRLADKQVEEPSPRRPEASTVREGRQPKSPPHLLHGEAVVKHSFREKLPLGPDHSVQILVVLNEDGRLKMCQKIVSYQPVTEEVTLKSGRKVPVSTYEETHHDIVSVHAFERVSVYDTKGRKVDAKELRKRLKKETVALLWVNDRPVDPLHLRLYKEDTLVFVLERQGPPHLPAVPPPAVGVPAAPQVVPAPDVRLIPRVAPPPPVNSPEANEPPSVP